MWTQVFLSSLFGFTLLASGAIAHTCYLFLCSAGDTETRMLAGANGSLLNTTHRWQHIHAQPYLTCYGTKRGEEKKGREWGPAEGLTVKLEDLRGLLHLTLPLVGTGYPHSFREGSRVTLERQMQPFSAFRNGHRKQMHFRHFLKRNL